MNIQMFNEINSQAELSDEEILIRYYRNPNSLNSEERKTIRAFFVANAIFNYTLKDNATWFTTYQNSTLKHENIRCEIKRDCVTLKKDNEVFKAWKLTERYPNILDPMCIPEAEKPERMKNYYFDSIALALNSKIPGDKVVVAGLVNARTPGFKRTHSWVEVSENGQTYVLDSVLNASMRKDDYYRLFQPEPLNEVTSDDIADDLFDDESPMNKTDNFGEYLLYRNEIIKETERTLQ